MFFLICSLLLLKKEKLKKLKLYIIKIVLTLINSDIHTFISVTYCFSLINVTYPYYRQILWKLVKLYICKNQ